MAGNLKLNKLIYNLFSKGYIYITIHLTLVWPLIYWPKYKVHYIELNFHSSNIGTWIRLPGKACC